MITVTVAMSTTRRMTTPRVMIVTLSHSPLVLGTVSSTVIKMNNSINNEFYDVCQLT